MNKSGSRAKEYLSQIMHADRELNRLKMQIDEINEQIESLKSPSTERHEKKIRTEAVFVNGFEILEELEIKLEQQYREKNSKYKIVIEQINNMNNALYADVLYFRYIKGMRFDEIEQTMQYSISQIFAFHRKALEMFENLYLKD